MSDKPQIPGNKDASKTGHMGTVAKFAKREDTGSITKQQAVSAKVADSSSQKNIASKPSYLDKINDYLKQRFLTEHEVIGVEIQPDVIRLCQAKNEAGEWKITKLASKTVLNNYSHDNIKKNKKVYAKALKELFQENKITNNSVALAIPASIAIIKTVSLPLMTRENLDRATRIPSFWQNLVQISSNLNEYSIYYRIVKESTATKEMDVLFIAAKHEDIKTYTEICKEAELEACVIDIGCYSINNLSKLKSEKSSSQQIFMKVGRDENYLQVLDDGKPYIYDIFVSDNEKNYLNEFIENPTFQQRFVSQLKHIISKHEDLKKVKLDKISVISSENNIDKFIAAINPRLENIEVKTIDLMENIKLPEELLKSEDFQKTKSSYAVCAGLATRNLDIFADENKMNVSETVNLLPNGSNIISALRAKFYSKILFWGSIIASSGFLIIYSIFALSSYHATRQETIRFNEQDAVYREKQKIFNDISAKSGVLNKLVRIKESLNPNQEKIISAFNEISYSIPEGVWIEEMRIEKEGKVIITGRSFEERGIITFSKSFDESQILENISISSLRSTALDNGSFVKEFIITGKLKGEATAAPQKQSGVK